MTRKIMLDMLSRTAIMIVVFLCLSEMAAMGIEPMTATIRVTSGALYDYVIVGEHPKATDSYDNAYDTISPGNLNADMGQPYISAIIIHPDWKPAMRELRGDIRSLAKRQEWQVTISSSLAKGTPLTMTLHPDQTTLPKGLKLILQGQDGKKEIDLATESYSLPAPGVGETVKLIIIAEQP